MIKFSEEKFADIWEGEFKQLAFDHWDETMRPVTNDEFNPDTKRYINFNEIGFYRLYTARKDGVLVGDIGIYITDSMHTQKKTATEDSWYMKPEVRNGRNSLRFLEFVENELKKMGVTSISTTTPPLAKSARLMEFCGYKNLTNGYHKELI